MDRLRWGIEYNGGTVWNNNLAGPNEIPGAVSGANILSDPCFGDFAQINWNGFVDGIEIVRDISISRDGLFIRMEQRMTNLGTDTKTDLYWMNNVDPDNNQTINGSFTTNQELIAQPSTGIDILGFVCASQGPLGGIDANGSSVCYYVQDVRSRVTYGGFTNRDPSAIWNGIGFEQAEGATNTADEAISVAFFFGDLGPGESVNFTYFYVFRDFTGGGVDPSFISITPVSPTECGLDDGQIVIAGLLPSIDYDISYVYEGTPVGPLIDVPADASGVITLTGLSVGNYTDFVLTNDSGCFFTNDGPIEIRDPDAPDFDITLNQPLRCDNDGSLVIGGLDPSTDYVLTYTQDGVVIGPTTVTTDVSGNIIINDLGEVTITSVTIELGSCSTIDPGTYVFEYPTPVLTVVLADPVMCDSDGSITISGLIPGTDYDVTYVLDGTGVLPITYTADGAGEIVITGLDEGTYTDITLILNECTYVIPGPFVLNRPSFDGFDIITIDPVTCGGSGQIIITGTLPGVTYSLTYELDGVPQGPISVTSDSTGSITITGLPAGTYDAGVLTYNDCVWNQPEPVVLNDPPSPTFTVTTVDSDVCGPNGSLILSGLIPGETYTITYTVDGVVVGPLDITADAAGEIIFDLLDQGNYTDITVELLECITVDSNIYTISYPADPTFTVTPIDPTTCTADGTIIIGGLFPATTYDITYTYEGTVVGPATLTTDAAGEITLTGLDQGTYENFIADFGACSGTFAGPVVINYPPDPTFTVTTIDPTTCSADGTIIITGLLPSTTFDITYTYEGTVVGPATLTTDAAGEITLTGLDQGTYENFIVDFGACSGTFAGPVEINYPPDPTFTVTASDSPTCSPDGSLLLSGLIPGATYSITYTYNGTVVGPVNATADASGNIIFTGLDEGTYTDISIEIDFCTGVDAGPYVIAYPASPAVNDPAAFEVCADGDGSGIYDLISRDSEITGGDANLVVTYHETSEDAESGDNPLSSPYTSSSNPQTIYVRVVDSVTGCVSTTTLDLVGLSIDTLSTPSPVESCPSSGSSGLTNQFDLTAFESELGVDLAGLTVTYHVTSVDAEDGTNAISNPTSYTNDTTPQTIYIRVENDLGCFGITATDISVIQCEIVVPQGISPNGDGFNDTFDVNGLDLHPNYVINIFDRRGLLVYTGNASTANWDGRAEQNSNLLPTGTYFYTIQLNDGPDDPFADVEQLYTGYVYLNY